MMSKSPQMSGAQHLEMKFISIASQLCDFGQMTSLHLTFPTCKMGIRLVLTSLGCGKHLGEQCI